MFPEQLDIHMPKKKKNLDTDLNTLHKKELKIDLGYGGAFLVTITKT